MQAGAALALQAGQTSTDDHSSLTPGRERAISASAEPIRSPFAGPLVGQHSNPLGAKAGIHAPRLQNQDTPRQHLPSPTSARTSRSQPGLQSGGLMQWHMSGVSSGMGLPSDGPLMSPTSPEPSGMSDVSSLTSYHGVPPWPQSSHPAGLQDPAGPSDDPSASGHSRGWVLQGTPANASDNELGDSGLGDSPGQGGSGWMKASPKDRGTHARHSSGWVQAAPASEAYATGDSAMHDSLAGHGSGWVQMPWDVGNPAGSGRGAGHGPAGPSGSGSQSGLMEEASEPSYREWVPESRTLQEARRLMSGEIQPAPSDFEATGSPCLCPLSAFSWGPSRHSMMSFEVPANYWHSPQTNCRISLCICAYDKQDKPSPGCIPLYGAGAPLMPESLRFGPLLRSGEPSTARKAFMVQARLLVLDQLKPCCTGLAMR